MLAIHISCILTKSKVLAQILHYYTSWGGQVMKGRLRDATHRLPIKPISCDLSSYASEAVAMESWGDNIHPEAFGLTLIARTGRTIGINSMRWPRARPVAINRKPWLHLCYNQMM